MHTQDISPAGDCDPVQFCRTSLGETLVGNPDKKRPSDSCLQLPKPSELFQILLRGLCETEARVGDPAPYSGG